MVKPGPKELDAGGPVQLPPQRLQAIDVAFDWAVAPQFGDGAFHRTEIVADDPHEALERVDVRWHARRRASGAG